MPDEHQHDLLKKLGLAVAEMGSVAKTQTADAGKYSYKYTDLSDVLRTVRSALEPHALALMQPITRDGDYMVVTTLVIDKLSGESLTFPGPPFKIVADPQAMGSSISYGRRYALTALFALAVEDDDGGSAHRAATRPQQRTPAEAEVRRIIAAMSADDQAAFQSDFRQEFNSTLTALSESKHGDALTYAKWWIGDEVEPTAEPAADPTPEETT